MVDPVWTLSETQPGPGKSGQRGRNAATVRGVVLRGQHGSSPWLCPSPSGWDDILWLHPLPDTRGVSRPLRPAPARDLQRGPGHVACRPCARVPSTGSHSGCAPRPHALCRPSSPGLGGGNRTPVSPSLSQALEKVASLGLRLRRGSACRCPEARPARESPAPAEGWRAWRRWHWLAAPAAPPCSLAPRWASWPGLHPRQPGRGMLPGPWGHPADSGRNSGPWLLPCCLAPATRTERLLARSPAPREAVATL